MGGNTFDPGIHKVGDNLRGIRRDGDGCASTGHWGRGRRSVVHEGVWGRGGKSLRTTGAGVPLGYVLHALAQVSVLLQLLVEVGEAGGA
jgi:hypothetical protein